MDQVVTHPWIALESGRSFLTGELNDNGNGNGISRASSPALSTSSGSRRTSGHHADSKKRSRPGESRDDHDLLLPVSREGTRA